MASCRYGNCFLPLCIDSFCQWHVEPYWNLVHIANVRKFVVSFLPAVQHEVVKVYGLLLKVSGELLGNLGLLVKGEMLRRKNLVHQLFDALKPVMLSSSVIASAWILNMLRVMM